MPPSASPAKRTTASPRKSQSSQNPGEKRKTPAKEKDKDGPPPGRDIRNFFAQPRTTAAGVGSAPAKSAASANGTGTGKRPITIDDSDEDEPIESKPPIKTENKPRASTTSKHFTSTSSSSNRPIVLDDTPSPPPKSAAKPSAPKSSSKAPAAAPSKPMPLKRKVIDSDDSDGGSRAGAGTGVRSKPNKRQSIGVGRRAVAKGKVNYLESSDEEEEEEEEEEVEVKPTVVAKGKKKEPSPMEIDDDEDDPDDFDDDDFDDEDADDLPKKSKSKTGAKPPPKPAAASGATKKSSTPKKVSAAATKKAVKEETATTPKASASSKAGGKSVQAKKEKEIDGDEADGGVKKEKQKFDWRAAAAARSAGPRAPGSKEIPEGAPNCLEGMTFVFTGELDSLGRDDAVELVKRYSGKVTGAPSGKTTFVVVGENAGASKLNKIKEKDIPTLDEDGFLNLIRTSSGPVLDEKAIKAREKEEKKIAEQAREMEKKEREGESERRRKEKALKGTGIAAKKVAPASAQLWTTKYAPTNVKEICGNKANVDRLLSWLQDWDKNYKSGFKKPGKDGMGMYRAVLISGPPGIGKTTSAHITAKLAGYSPIELNASDTRSKKLIENSTNIDNTSLDGFLHGGSLQSTTVAGVKVDSKTCLIMDEVDGMSAGDRGGVGALNVLIKKTRIPMILICNDRTLQKMKPLQSTTFNMTFRRPQPQEIRSRIMSILFKEKMKIPPNVVDELIKGTNSDIRQVLNMLSTFKLGKSEMDFDEGKQLIKINEKNTILTPFTIIDRLTHPYAFSKTNKESLNEKSELYFHDISFVPLFMQEHYLKTQPAALSSFEGQEHTMKHLERVSKAADWISDGDLIDRMIHGSEQHWSLLPLHAIASTVAPAFNIYGGMRSTGGPGGWGPSFPQWLGQNSKQGKLQRQLTDIQIRMRLRVSGSRQEIREQYMPMLASRIVLPLAKDGSEAIESTIETMDEYFLSKDDWDAFVELGVDTMNGDAILKKIPTATKTAFTRQYNKADHPIAFHKGDMFAMAKKKIADIGPAPDNDEVFEEDEPVPDDDEGANGEDEGLNDVSKDRLIKEVKKKADKAAKGKKK